MGPLEAAVMQRIWAADEPQSVREVQEQISTDRVFAYTTVMTVMDNLHSKGLLKRVRKGRAYLYSSTQTREQYTASVLGEVLADGGDRRGVLMHFVDHLDSDALASLRQVLEDSPREGGESS
jgi:predicted transcriptional regulator